MPSREDLLNKIRRFIECERHAVDAIQDLNSQEFEAAFDEYATTLAWIRENLLESSIVEVPARADEREAVIDLTGHRLASTTRF